MRALGAKKGIGIGLAVGLVVVALGGWLLLRSSGDSNEPIVVGVTDRVDSLDPAMSYGAGSWDLYSNIYQGLLTVSTGSEEPVPDAAESCEFTDNAYQVYRCTLRSDLKFTSGRSVTPEDVKFSIERILTMGERAAADRADESIPEEEKFKFSGPYGLLSGVEAIRVDGQDVVFELENPEVTFPFALAGGAGSIVDREEYELDEATTDLAVGSGPYRLVEFEDADEESGRAGKAVLEPNTDYNGALQASDYPVTIRFYADSASLQQAWEAREIHLNGGRMEPEDTQQVDRNDLDIRYSETTGQSIRALISSTASSSPLNDEDVRRVMATLLDRDAIARDVRLHTVEAAYSLIPVGVTGHGTPYYDIYSSENPDDAVDDLIAGGASLPIDITIGYSGAVNQAEAELVAQQLEADGVFEVEVESFEVPGKIIEAFGKGEVDAYLVGWRPDFADPDTYTHALLTEGSILGHGKKNGEIDELISQTRSEVDRGNTGELFREIHRLAAEDAVVIPIWQDRNFVIADREITGLQHLRDAGGQFRLWELQRL